MLPILRFESHKNLKYPKLHYFRIKNKQIQIFHFSELTDIKLRLKHLSWRFYHSFECTEKVAISKQRALSANYSLIIIHDYKL